MKPEEITVEKIAEILESGVFDTFIGYSENVYFEAKSKKPWMYDDPDPVISRNARIEMANDIGCLVNKNEAYILLGLSTPNAKLAKTTSRDYIVSVNMFPETELYDAEVLRNKLKGFIYPIPNIHIKWYPSVNDPKMGIGAIHISADNAINKPFLVTINLIEGEIHKQFFSLPERVEDGTTWKKAEQFHNMLKIKPSDWQAAHAQIMAKLDKMEDRISHSVLENENPDNDLAQKMEELKDEF